MKARLSCSLDARVLLEVGLTYYRTESGAQESDSDHFFYHFRWDLVNVDWKNMCSVLAHVRVIMPFRWLPVLLSEKYIWTFNLTFVVWV